MSQTPYRIFLSSPGDVGPEREAAARVVDRINGDHATPLLHIVLWERAYYTALSTFQAQIDRPSQCDLVVCIFWKRLGSPLPDAFKRDDGTIPTGTEFEFEDAMEAARLSPEKLPDLLAYRKTAAVTFSEDTVEQERLQRANLLSFWDRWFRSEVGQFTAGYQTFEDTSEFEEMLERHLRDWLALRLGSVTWTDGNPYRGLAPFDVEHAPIFFGRRREVERLRARFLANAANGQRFLLVAGPSGSGKSSLVRAGLLARLSRRGSAASVGEAVIHIGMRPALLGAGTWPQALAQAIFGHPALAAALQAGDFTDAAALAQLFVAGGPAAAAPLVGALARDAGSDRHLPPLAPDDRVALILLVDQMEELFAWPDDAAQAFAALLATFADQPGLHVLGTMRSDFLHRLTEVPALDVLVGQGEIRPDGAPERVLHVSFPRPADLREMITGPARAAGLTFADATGDRPALDQRIEEATQPTALPAMQFLLSELWSERADNQLTHTAYEALGQVGGVMAARGEDVVTGHSAVAFATLMRALVRRPSPDRPAVSATVPMDRFAEDSPEGRLAGALREARLITSDEGMIRLAHESLLTGWTQLADLLRDERRHYAARDRLVDVMATRPDERLDGFLLEEGRDLRAAWGDAALEADATGLPALIKRSDQASRRSRALRVTLGAAVLIGATGGLGAILWSQQNTRIAEDMAEALNRSTLELRLGNWDDALAAAKKASDLARTPTTNATLLAALADHSTGDRAITPAQDAVSVAWTGPNTYLALSGGGGLTRVTDGVATPLDPLPTVGLSNLTVASDGTLYAMDDQWFVHRVIPDGPILQADLTDTIPGDWPTGFTPSSGYQVALTPMDDGVTVTFLMNRDTFSTTCFTQDAPRCEPATRQPVGQAAHMIAADASGQIAFASDNSPGLLPLDNRPPVRFDGENWRAPVPATGRRVGRFDAISLAVSASGDRVAVGDRDGTLGLFARLPQQDTLTLIHVLDVDRPISALAWSNAGDTLAYPCEQRSICFADVGPDPTRPVVVLTGRTLGAEVPPGYLTWSPDDRRLLAITVSGDVSLWDLHQTEPGAADYIVVSPEEPVDMIAVAPDGMMAQLASGIHRVSNTAPPVRPRPVAFAAPANADIFSMALDAGGLRAVGLGDGSVDVLGDTPLTVPSGSRVMRVAALPETWVATTHGTGAFRLVSENEVLEPAIDTAFGVLADPDGTAFYVSTWTGIKRVVPGAEPEQVFGSDDIGDARSAGSLAIDPSGRWLAASRSDDLIRVYDLTPEAAHITLPLVTEDTKVVAFSPAGDLLAALGSDGRIYVWSFDPSGDAAPLWRLDRLPAGSLASGGNERAARWITFDADGRLAVATASGEILLLPTDIDAMRARAESLLEARVDPRLSSAGQP
ncbi:MAG: AAA family ATPase [Pseudomonadota bacterium]